MKKQILYTTLILFLSLSLPIYSQLEKHNKLTFSSIALSLLDKVYPCKAAKTLRSGIGFVDELLAGYSNASAKTEALIKAILKEINYTHDIKIKRLHTLGRFLKGDANIYVTSSNHILVSEDWFHSLSYEEQKFIVTQRIVQLEQYHNILRYLIEFASGMVAKKYGYRIEKNENGIPIIHPPSEPLYIIITRAVRSTLIRALSNDADLQALKRINCNTGAQEFFEKRSNYIGTNSTISKVHMVYERLRDLVHATPLYYLTRNNLLNEDRLEQALDFKQKQQSV